MTQEDSRPRTATPSQNDSPNKSRGAHNRLTEYQQVYPGTPAFASTLDGDVNKAVYTAGMPKSSPKLPTMNSITAYSEFFKTSSPKSLVRAQYPFEDSAYKRHTSTPIKSHSQDQYRSPDHVGYDARGKRCDPKGHLTTGTTCDFWASSYQLAHPRSSPIKEKIISPKKSSPKKTEQKSLAKAGNDAVNAILEVQDMSKLWCASAYQLAFGSTIRSESEPTLRAATAPCRSRRKRPPVVKGHGSNNDGHHANHLSFSTPNLPAV